tara:strand:+ start:256 stop:1017 length:762 start_codon:yes stop_codon:yes gene_type:complete
MAILPWLTGDFQTSFTLVALNSIIIPGLIMFNTRREFKFRPAVALAIAAVFGTFLGFHFMNRNVEGAIFIRFFGAVLILFTVVDIILTRAFRYTMPKWMAWPCGMLGGFFGGAFNIGGPPMVAYVYSQPWSKQQTVATLQAAFIAATGYRICLMGFNGYFDRSVFHLTLYTVIPTAIGIYVGGKLLDRVNRDRLKMAVFVFVGILGFKYLFYPPEESAKEPPPQTIQSQKAGPDSAQSLEENLSDHTPAAKEF